MSMTSVDDAPDSTRVRVKVFGNKYIRLSRAANNNPASACL